MEENAKKVEKEIARDKLQAILSGIAVAILVIMEIYIMINMPGNFIAMVVPVLLLTVALFFLISAMVDLSLRAKDRDQKNYEDLCNAQKASYLVIKKSFEELEERLRSIEENASAEDIINAQKAMAKVTINHGKENTDALISSNDELINELSTAKDQIQLKISELSLQLSKLETQIQSGITVNVPQPQIMPVYAPVEPMPVAQPQPFVQEEPIAQEQPVAEVETPDLSGIEDILNETSIDEGLTSIEESVDDLLAGLPTEEADVSAETEGNIDDLLAELPIEDLAEPTADELEGSIDDLLAEMPEMDLAENTEESVDDLLAEQPIESMEVPEEPILESIPEPVAEMAIEEAIAEPIEEAAAVDDLLSSIEEIAETIIDDTPALEPEAPVVEEQPQEEPAAVEPVAAEEPNLEEMTLEEETAEIDSILNDLSIELDEPVAEAPAEAPAPVEIPDVGIDLSDPNRVMSPEEIQKLFANI